MGADLGEQPSCPIPSAAQDKALFLTQIAASCVSELALHTVQRQPASITGYYLITNNLSMLYSKWNQNSPDN